MCVCVLVFFLCVCVCVWKSSVVRTFQPLLLKAGFRDQDWVRWTLGYMLWFDTRFRVSQGQGQVRLKIRVIAEQSSEKSQTRRASYLLSLQASQLLWLGSFAQWRDGRGVEFYFIFFIFFPPESTSPSCSESSGGYTRPKWFIWQLEGLDFVV